MFVQTRTFDVGLTIWVKQAPIWLLSNNAATLGYPTLCLCVGRRPHSPAARQSESHPKSQAPGAVGFTLW